MKNEIFAILSIIGTIIGSGFVSGKEIVVFFSRFGLFSLFGIILAFLLFFFLIKFFLNKSQNVLKNFYIFKYSFFANIFLCLIFSSAMFAGMCNLLKNLNYFICLIIIFFVLILCFLIFKKGIGCFEKINFIFVPIMLIILIFNLFSSFKLGINFENNYPWYISLFYSALYVTLNLSNGSILICKLGNSLNKKQKTRVAFLSALVLFAILFTANIILLQNQSSFVQVMPLLSIFSGIKSILMSIVIFFGCITTLFSLVYTSSFSLRGLCNNEFFIFLISVFFPVVLSLLGFDFIVLYLYPIASILGFGMIFELFFIPFFKRTYKKIHSSSENTK